MMTSSNENIFRVTGPLCGKFTGHRWIPLTKASDAGLWCFLWSATWINGWVNNREAGDLSRHRAHYDVTVMLEQRQWCGCVFLPAVCQDDNCATCYDPLYCAECASGYFLVAGGTCNGKLLMNEYIGHWLRLSLFAELDIMSTLNVMLHKVCICCVVCCCDYIMYS